MKVAICQVTETTPEESSTTAAEGEGKGTVRLRLATEKVHLPFPTGGWQWPGPGVGYCCSPDRGEGDYVVVGAMLSPHVEAPLEGRVPCCSPDNSAGSSQADAWGRHADFRKPSSFLNWPEARSGVLMTPSDRGFCVCGRKVTKAKRPGMRHGHAAIK